MRDVFTAVFCLLLAVTVGAQTPENLLEKDPHFLAACSKLAANPDEAASGFDGLLKRYNQEEVRRVLVGKRAEAWFRGRRIEKLLEGFIGKQTENTVVDFWVACGLQQTGRLAEAVSVFEGLVQRVGFGYAREARQSLARALVVQGKHDLALAHMAALVDSNPSPELRMEAAAVALLAGNVGLASNWLDDDLLEDHPFISRCNVLRCFVLSHKLDWEAVEELARVGRESVSAESGELQWLDWWHAHALVRSHRIKEAIEIVTTFIEKPENSDWLEHGFALLEVCEPTLNPEVADALNRWKQSPGSLGALARFYGHLWFGEDSKQVNDMLRMVAAEEAHPARLTAQLRLVERAFESDNSEEGFALLRAFQAAKPGRELMDRAAFVEARFRFRKKQYSAARDVFLTWPFAGDLPMSLLAQFNAGVIALADNNQEGCQAGVQWLKQWNDDVLAQSLAWELEAARAFHAATTASPRAVEFLNQVVNRHPDSETRSRARLAIAEWYVVGGDPQWAEARRWLNSIPADTGGATNFRREVLGLLIEAWNLDNAKPDLAKRMRQTLIGAEPNHETALLRLTLGRLLLSQKEDKNAVSVLLEGRLEDRALFPAEREAIMLGGIVALRLGDPVQANRAITALGEIVSRAGPAAAAARLLQARALVLAGGQRKAITQLDHLIEHAAMNPDLADQARLFKGEWLVRQSGISEKPVTEDARVSLEQALALWAEVCENDKASAAHRQEGWFRRGRCFEHLQKPRKALESYYQGVETVPQIVQTDHGVASGSDSGAAWYFRCGFRALAMLEAEDRWESAILLAERLAKGEGDDAKQARSELNRLRLKHFEL